MGFDIFDGDFDADEFAVGLGVGEEIGLENAEDEAKAKRKNKGDFEVDPDEGFGEEDDGGDAESSGMRASIKGERPKGAVSLKDKKESNLPPFETWVRDIITGKKDLDDDL